MSFGKPFAMDQLPLRYQEQASQQLHRPSPPTPKPVKAKGIDERASQTDRETSRAESEQTLRPPSVEPPQGETLYSGRVSVRVVSYRRRLLDPDNLCAKWFLDACRYARLIRDDRPQDITYSVSQEKVACKEEERTEILISPIE